MNDTPQLELFTIAFDDLPPIVPITQKQVKDLTARRFGRLFVLGFTGVNRFNQATWLCQCDCGKHSVVARPALINGDTSSCGCLHNEIVGAMTRTHGLRKTTEYRIWAGIKSRCHNANTLAYKNYGARGITMCLRWLNSFENFLEDMGLRPTAKHTIDRINNDLGYSPENCRWATKTEQANNKRGNRILEFRGRRLTISEWARNLNMSYSVLSSRVGKLGWSAEKALTTTYGVQTIEYKGERLSFAEWSRRTGINQRTLRHRIESGWSVQRALTTPTGWHWTHDAPPAIPIKPLGEKDERLPDLESTFAPESDV